VDERTYTVTVTRGLLDTLDRAELQAVLGHELTHIINRDTRLMMVCAVFAGIITFAAEMVFRAMRYSDLRSRRRENRKGGGFLVLIALALMAVGYLLAVVLRFAISRKREFLADAGSVELTKDPDAMISALQKIDGRARLAAPAQVRPLFFEDRASGLFATHPPIAARIAALVKYAGGRIEPAETAVPVTP
jgi:heat shock protein HtpX